MRGSGGSATKPILTYDVHHIGSDRDALQKLAKMDHSDKKDTRGVMIVGQAALRGDDGAAVLATCMQMAEAGGSKLLVLHNAASRVGAMDIGAHSEDGLAIMDGADTVYALGSDALDIPDGPTVIYQGSHGDRGAHRADIILPGCAWTEEQGLFVNTEGRPQTGLAGGLCAG